MAQFIFNSAVYIYICRCIYIYISQCMAQHHQNKRNSKVKVISSTSSTYPININQPNQRLTRDTNQPLGLPGRPIRKSPSISSSAQLNLQRCLEDLMAIFQSTTSLLRGLEYGLYGLVTENVGFIFPMIASHFS